MRVMPCGTHQRLHKIIIVITTVGLAQARPNKWDIYWKVTVSIMTWLFAGSTHRLLRNVAHQHPYHMLHYVRQNRNLCVQSAHDMSVIMQLPCKNAPFPSLCNICCWLYEIWAFQKPGNKELFYITKKVLTDEAGQERGSLPGIWSGTLLGL